MTRFTTGRRESGMGPALTHPKRPGAALIAGRWWQELTVGGALASGLVAAIVRFGLGHTLLGLAGVVVAAGGACTRPEVRRLIAARFWLMVTPHRVRTCFARAWVYNERGQIPAVLRATRTRYGERVLVWCRAGIGFADIESSADLLAAACFAMDVIARRDPRYGHLLYLDVIRWPGCHVGPERAPEPGEDEAPLHLSWPNGR